MDSEVVFSHESEDYKAHMEGERWVKIRAEAIEFHGSECKACKKKNQIDVHHLTYKAWTEQRDELMEELLPLCRTCHKEVHKLNDLEKLHRLKSLKRITEEYIAQKTAVTNANGYIHTRLPTVHTVESRKGIKKKGQQPNNLRNSISKVNTTEDTTFHPKTRIVTPPKEPAQVKPNQTKALSKTQRKKLAKAIRTRKQPTKKPSERLKINGAVLQLNFSEAILQQAKKLHISIEAKNIIGQIAKVYDQDIQRGYFLLSPDLSPQLLSEIYKIWIPDRAINSFTLVIAVKRNITPTSTPVRKINTNKTREEYLKGRRAIDLYDRTKQ